MKLTTQTDPETAILKLTGYINIYQIELLKHALAESIGTGTDLVVDLSGVEICDFTGLQLLYAAARSARMHGRRLEIVSPSASFSRSISQLGFPTRTHLSV